MTRVELLRGPLSAESLIPGARAPSPRITGPGRRSWAGAMPGVGLEPTSSCERRLLRPLPLPIWAPGPLWGSYSQRPRSCRARGVDWRRSARTGRGRRLGAAAASRRGRGGIGRHAGLRSRWAKALGGSSPSARIGKNLIALFRPIAGRAKARVPRICPPDACHGQRHASA